MAGNPVCVRGFLKKIWEVSSGTDLENNIVQIFSILDDDCIYPCLSHILLFVRKETRYAPITVGEMLWDSGVHLHQLLNAICDVLKAHLSIYDGTSVSNASNKFNCAFKEFRMISMFHINKYCLVIDVEEFDRVCDEFEHCLTIAIATVNKLIAINKLNLFITLMLAHKRCVQSTQEDVADDATCTEFPMAIASLPSVLFEMIAEAMITKIVEVEP
jgi:hypothetical protein